MHNFTNRYRKWVVLLTALLLLFCASTAQAVIQGALDELGGRDNTSGPQ